MGAKRCYRCNICHMPDLNLRNVDPELVADLKATAARLKITLRELCILKLRGGAAVEGQTERKISMDHGRTWHPSSMASCPSCGGLSGLHQKGCKA